MAPYRQGSLMHAESVSTIVLPSLFCASQEPCMVAQSRINREISLLELSIRWEIFLVGRGGNYVVNYLY